MDSAIAQQENEKQNLILSFPREKSWSVACVYLFQDFWCPSTHIHGVINFLNHFQANDSDVIVASVPKSGTTWLKALTFSIVNHKRFSSLENYPLLTSNPHELVPFLDFIFRNGIPNPISHPSNVTESRVFGTHIPFASLSKSIKESNCKIIYICRNPFDTFISAWIFFNKIREESLPVLTIDEAFEMYCRGLTGFGPWWNSILGYWKQSLTSPNKVLFLKYEDVKEDVNFHVKRVAEFLGCPFTDEEETNGVIEGLIKLCSFEMMKDLEINKSGIVDRKIEKKYLFRKAEIGDWGNYFSSSMIEKLSKIIDEKFIGSGLSFKMYS